MMRIKVNAMNQLMINWYAEVSHLLGKGGSEHIPVSVGIDCLNVTLRARKWTSYFAFGKEKRDRNQAQETSRVLQNIRGVVKPGQLLAILGSSGVICSI